MTPTQELELIDALKRIATSFEQLNRYVMVVTQQKLGIAPIRVEEAAALHRSRR